LEQYKSFPPLDEIIKRLEAMDGYRPDRAALYRRIAERLAGKTFDNAAFALLLIELLHRHEGPEVDDLAEFLPRCILTLSGDEELADSARQAFRELGPGGDRM
jgi:hypothetical protein